MATRRASHYARDAGTKERHCSTCTMFVAPHKCTAVAGFIAKRGLCDWFEKGAEKVAFASGGRVLAHYVDRNPTEAQKRAGNYRKAHVSIHGLDVAIENPKGSTRSGVGADGKPWSSVLPAHYGYIKRTEGADGDHVDVYLGPHLRSQRAWIVDQRDLGTGKWDEHKVFLGFGSEAQVRRTYAAAFSDGKGRERIGGVRELSVDALKDWLKRGDTTKPAARAA